MYIVLSCDIHGTQEVTIHCVSVDGIKALNNYENVCKRYKDYNEHFVVYGIRRVVDLMRVPDEFDLEDGVCFFGKHNFVQGVERIASSL